MWELIVKPSPVCFQHVYGCGWGCTTTCVFSPELWLSILGGRFCECMPTYSSTLKHIHTHTHACTLRHTYSCTIMHTSSGTLTGVFTVSSPTSCKDQIQSHAVLSSSVPSVSNCGNPLSSMSSMTLAVSACTCQGLMSSCTRQRLMLVCRHQGCIKQSMFLLHLMFM